jgi:PsbP-like protein
MSKLKQIGDFFSRINSLKEIVVGTFAIVTGIMFFKSQQEWVSYHSLNYGVQLSHPQNWIKELKDPGTERGSILTLNPPNSRIECQDKVVVETIKPEKFSPSLESYERDQIDRLKKMNQVIKIDNKTTVKTQLSQMPAFRLNYQREDSQCGTRKVVEIATINNGKIYSILYDANPQSFGRDLATFNKIIDSFKLD